MNNAPVGSQRLCRFSSTNRKLTSAEEETFLETGVLPVGTGTDPTTRYIDIRTPDGVLSTKSGSEVTRAAAGSFSYTIPVEAEGNYHWRGYGKDAGGNPVFSTKKQSFRGVAF